MKYEHDRSSHIIFKRLLAKHDLKHDSYKTYSRKKYANYGMNKNIKSGEEKKLTYSQIRGGCLYNFDTYMKDYKNRYAKKKGLAKLDCYFEKNVLKKINNIFEISENMRKKKKYYNKKLYNKYVTCLVLFSVVPFFGFILILYFSKFNPYMLEACFSGCRHKHGGSTISSFEESLTNHLSKNKRLLYISKEHFNIIEIVNDVFLCLSFPIVLLVLLYILLKMVKYQRIRSGKGTMTIKDYYHFFRDLITAK
ncbi:hypothetical protein PVMG_02283 [Plasmodium vivax Mauritania I]|uniref:Variable surface protein Vir35 n=1 Tax=Plasmodium vivax Mauritania I TaxID=1035515 RepID=A0A0J9TH11_PLAVI|nr:hypothetical protein PVMG_02283 [Plasmodium vivax Mauritania I]